jgi:hypothetical protein
MMPPTPHEMHFVLRGLPKAVAFHPDYLDFLVFVNIVNAMHGCLGNGGG